MKTLLDFRALLQADGGDKLIELLTETALEIMGNTNSAPARPLAVSVPFSAESEQLRCQDVAASQAGR